MVEPDDPSALAAGIIQAMSMRDSFDGAAISRRIIARFGREAWRRQAMAMYESVITGNATESNAHG
jgi:hypothetical protein